VGDTDAARYKMGRGVVEDYFRFGLREIAMITSWTFGSSALVTTMGDSKHRSLYFD